MTTAEGETERQNCRINILGPITAGVGDDLVEVRGQRRQAVLVALALAAGQTVTRERLLASVWGEDCPPTATTSLRVLISQLRKVVGEELLETAENGYRLAVTPAEVDALVFRQLADHGREMLHQRRYPAAYETLQSTMELWHEPQWPDHGALWEESSSLANTKEEVELLLAEARLLAEGLPPDIATLEELTQRYPYRERAWELLMTALYWAGRQAEALGAFQRAKTVLREELGLDPGPSLVDVETAILNQDPRLDPPSPATVNLPRYATEFIGRHDQVAELTDLAVHRRLVTVVGLGGAGKTRLAVEAAGAAAEDFPDGVVCVELGPVADADLVPRQIGQAVGTVAETVDGIVTHLGSARMLIVLDNAEHLAAAVAETANALITECPNLTVLVTSRTPLQLQAEVVWPIPLLAVPENDTVEECQRSDAVQLFLARAQTVASGFHLDQDNAAPIADACRLLAGHPLGIELAAARCGALSSSDIAKRLRTGGAMEGAEHDRPERHRSVDVALNWTTEALTTAQRALLRRLAVFQGAFDLRGVESVCLVSPVTESNLVDCLDGLAKSSLMQVDRESDRCWYRLLTPVHGMAQQMLEKSGEAPMARTRHREAMRSLVQDAGDGSHQAEAPQLFARVDAYANDVRAVLDQAGCEDPAAAAEMCVQLRQYWTSRRSHHEVLRRIESLLEHRGAISDELLASLYETASWFHLDNGSGVSSVKEAALKCLQLRERIGDAAGVATAKLLLGAGVSHGGDHERAYCLFNEAQSTLEHLGHDSGMLRAGINAGIAAQKLGRLDDADTHLQVALSAAHRTGARALEALVLERRSYLAAERDDAAAADALVRAAHQIRVELNDPLELSRSYWSLGISALVSKDPTTATRNMLESMRLAQEHRLTDAWWIPGLIELAAVLMMDQGSLLAATRLLGAAESLRSRSGLGPNQQTVPGLDEARRSLEETLGADTFGSELSLGAAQTGPVALRRAQEGFAHVSV